MTPSELTTVPAPAALLSPADAERHIDGQLALATHGLTEAIEELADDALWDVRMLLSGVRARIESARVAYAQQQVVPR